MAFLTRTDAAKNLHRFYVVRLAPTLFGDWTLLRETSFERFDDAQQAEARTIKRRIQHGYSEREARA